MTDLKVTQADYDAGARLYGYAQYDPLYASSQIITAAEHFARHRAVSQAELVEAVSSYLYAIDEGLGDFLAEKRLRAALARVKGEKA